MDIIDERIYVSYGLNPDRWSNSVGLKEAAKDSHLKPERLAEFAEKKLCPHYVVDGGEPIFHKPTLRRWVQENLLKVNEGYHLPLVEVQEVVAPEPIADTSERPDSLRSVEGLRVAPENIPYSGVYFLCRGNTVVYVGQSINVAGRRLQHKASKDFDRVYYIPVAQDHLMEVEAQFIRQLRPEYNLRGAA